MLENLVNYNEGLFDNILSEIIVPTPRRTEQPVETNHVEAENLAGSLKAAVKGCFALLSAGMRNFVWFSLTQIDWVTFTR